MTAVDEVERFIAHPPAQTATDAPQLGPTAPASADVVPPAEAAPSPTPPPPPAVTSVPAAPSPSWAGTSTPNPGPAFGPTTTPAAPAPPVGVRPQSPSRGSSSHVEGRRATPGPPKPPLPRAARPGVGGSGDVAPAHTSGQNPVHSTGPSRPSSPTSPTVRQPSGNASTEQGQGPYVVYLPPTPPQQQVQPPAEQPRVSPQPAPAPTALPPSQSTPGPRTGARAPISESEVEQATGDSEIARESQTPAGREILRQLFGGADQ
jgi:hypothetical protein